MSDDNDMYNFDSSDEEDNYEDDDFQEESLGENDFQEESLGENDLGINEEEKEEVQKDSATNNNELADDKSKSRQTLEDENDEEDEDEYGDYDDDFEDLETSKISNNNNTSSSFPSLKINKGSDDDNNKSSIEDALHQQAFNNLRSKSMGNVASFASLVASESNEEEISTTSLQQQQYKLDRQINNMDRTNNNSSDTSSSYNNNNNNNNDYDIVKKTNMLSPTRSRQDGGIPSSFASTRNSGRQESSQSINLDPVSTRTSIALLSMLGELSDHDVNKLKVSDKIDHKLVNTLDWLASAGVLTDGNLKYSDNSCLSQTTMQNTTTTSSKRNSTNQSELTLPGGVDEAVMKLIVECVLENLDEEPTNNVVEQNSANSPSSLNFIARERNIPTKWTVDESDERVNDLMPMVEENYLEMVKKVTKINLQNMTFPSDYEFSQYASHQRLLKIQKHMVEIMCDIFTDPSVIQTVKMGVTSRVLNEEDSEMRKLYKK